MANSNYLVSFLNQVDILISEIDRLKCRIRLCKNSSKIFKIEFKSKLEISPDPFIKLRNFLAKSIEANLGYNRRVVELKREFARNFKILKNLIEKEILQIENFQEIEMNKIVYKAIYDAKIDYENRIKENFNVKSSLLDKFIGIKKYRNLSIQNHELKIKLAKKEYEEKKNERKTIFELANMIENADIKTGELLCLQEKIIKTFMLDKKILNREKTDKWKPVMVIPHGFKAKIEHYKILNKNLIRENQELEKTISENRLLGIESTKIGSRELILLNSKLGKLLNERILKVGEI